MDRSSASAETDVLRAGRKWAWVAGGAVVIVGLAFWAGRTTLTPPVGLASTADEDLVVVVSERTIGQTLDYGARISRATRSIATNHLAGVVTAAPEQQVTERGEGDLLYEVAGVPVRIIQGDVPSYRDLSEGTRGKDVAQLEKTLVALGYLPRADEVYDAATRGAVSSWQRSLGTPETGSVARGELVVADSLPGSVIVDEKQVWPGAVLSGGEVVVSKATGEPQFVLPLSPGQIGLVPKDAPMSVEFQGRTWPAVWASSQANDELGVGEMVTLTSPDGGPVCGDECNLIPADQAWVTVHIEVIPRTTGPAVPVSAVVTDAAGLAWVTVVDGDQRERRAVTVTRSHAGLAVVDGVEVGEEVQILAADAGSESPVPGNAPTSTPSQTPG